MDLSEFCVKKSNFAPLISYCEKTLENFKSQYSFCAQEPTSTMPIQDRKICGHYRRAMLAKVSIYRAIDDQLWGVLEREFREFEQCVNHWGMSLHTFNQDLKASLLPKVTAKQRLLKLVENDPHWMTAEIKADLIEVLSKGTVKDPKAKGRPRAKSRQL